MVPGSGWGPCLYLFWYPERPRKRCLTPVAYFAEGILQEIPGETPGTAGEGRHLSSEGTQLTHMSRFAVGKGEEETCLRKELFILCSGSVGLG